MDGHIGAVGLDGFGADAAAVFKEQLGRFRFEQILAAHFDILVIGLGKVAFGQRLAADIGREDRPLAADKADRGAEFKAVALQPVAGLAGFVDHLGDQLGLGTLHAVDGGVIQPGFIERVGIHQRLAGGLGVDALNRVVPVDDLGCHLARRVDVRGARGGGAGAAPFTGLVDGEDPDAGLGCGEGGGGAGRAHADYQDVGFIVFAGVALRDRGIHARKVHARIRQRVDDALADTVGLSTMRGMNLSMTVSMKPLVSPFSPTSTEAIFPSLTSTVTGMRTVRLKPKPSAV